MDTVLVNVDSYDETTHSLIVNFTGTVDGVEYTTSNYAFQVANYNTTDHQEILKKIASVGTNYIIQIAARDALAKNEEIINYFKNLSSSNHRFVVNDLVTQPVIQPINGVADNLEVIL